MTATKDVTIWCDGGGRMVCGRFMQGDTAKTVRRVAEMNGWVCAVQDTRSPVTPAPTLDFCPLHKSQAL